MTTKEKWMASKRFIKNVGGRIMKNEEIKINGNSIQIGNKVCYCVDKDLINYITNLQQENERLNNIINELEDYICGIEYDERFYNETLEIAVRIHNKLKELKESVKW